MSATTNSKIKGVTTSEFDGVSLPTLRAWKRWWEKEDRKIEDAEVNVEGRDVERNIRMIALEIGRREEARKA